MFMDDKMQNTGERLIPGDSDLPTFYEHTYRYAFACRLLKGLTILDIASGEGYGTDSLSKCAKSVIGIDVDLEAVNHAKEKYGLDYRVGNAERIPLENDSVDAIVSFETIEHLSDPRKFLEELFRVLKPGGHLVISTPNKKIYHADQPPNPFHVSELTYAEFHGLLSPLFVVKKTYGQIFSNDLPLNYACHESGIRGWIHRRLKNKFWPDLNTNFPEDLDRLVHQIPRLSKPMDELWNPYALRKINHANDQKSKYMIAVALKKRS
jgi:ubiquinone/menaquinone biosynthesis C-methylase UbiE